MPIILSIIAILLTLADTYVVLSVLSGTSWLAKGWLYLPAIALWILIIWMMATGDTRQMLLNSIMWIVICFVLPTLVFTILSLVGKAFGLMWHPLYGVFSWIGFGIAGAWFVIAVYGSVFGWRRIEVKTTEIHSADIPQAFQDYRIVQLTDFHIGVYAATPAQVDKIVDKVNSLNPDLIVFTGDLVNTSPDELPEFTNALSHLKAKDGVISVLGNHDYCIYHRYDSEDGASKALERVVDTEKSMGWKLLRNESIQINRGNDSIAIVGVENAGSRGFPNKADLKKAMTGLTPEEFKILLSHDPSHWRREVLPQTNIHLMLAGHTHAMQFRLGNFSPSEWTYPEWGGLYLEGNRQLYVSTGIGGNIAFRFGVYPTIDLLILKR